MITVLTFLWGSRYTAAHVNALQRQVKRHYARPHRFAVVTNQPQGLQCDVVVPDFEDFAGMKSPRGAAFPSCYRRLRLFHPDAAKWYGERFVCLDIDWTIHADVTPLWDRPEPFVALRDPYHGGRGQYCGAMLLLTAGAKPEVWEKFNPNGSPQAATLAGFKGSDQAWISHMAPGAPTWSTADGVYSYKVDCRNGLPSDARMVNFHGTFKPWTCGKAWAREAA